MTVKDSTKHYCVYALQTNLGNQNALKIGMTGNLAERISTIQTSMPAPLILLGHWNMPSKDQAGVFEQSIHQKNQALKISGEWYDDRILESIPGFDWPSTHPQFKKLKKHRLQLNYAALMEDKYFNDKTRFYFSICAAVENGRHINKEITDIAFSADVEYRKARRFMNELVENGKVIRTGKPRHYKYELNEIYSWHGSEESRNNRVAKRQRQQLTEVQKKAVKANMSLLDGGKS